MSPTKILSEAPQERRGELARFISSQGDYDHLIVCAHELGQSMAGDDLTKSQLRNIYGMVKQMQAEGFDKEAALKLKLLRPKLAYVAAKERKLEKLTRVLDEAIQLVGFEPRHFERFADFFEAVVAYHYAEDQIQRKNRR